MTALTLQPNHQLYYCVTSALDSVVRSSTLTGRATPEVAAVSQCTGIALDYKHLYVATTNPDMLMRGDLDGGGL